MRATVAGGRSRTTRAAAASVSALALAAGWTGAGWSAAAGKPPKVIVMGTPEPPPRGSPPPLTSEEQALAAAAAEVQGVAVAQASFVESRIEVRAPDAEWQTLPEGGRVRTGDRLRTGPESVARLDFPWMSVSLAPGSELKVPKGTILGLAFESGRVELSSERGDLIKLDTAEARVRGRGRIVVRRDAGATRVSLVQGSVSVHGGGKTTVLAPGFGCVLERDRACAPVALPPPPEGLRPGNDPSYVAVGERLALAWHGEAPGFHVQVLSFDSDAVLLERDVATATLELGVPWPGLYRYRVSARGPAGLEGPPSLEGLFQVMPLDWLKSSAVKE